MNIAMEYPALTGQVVTQAHADHCAANGHATHTVTDLDGVSTVAPWCPRCGASITGEQTPTTPEQPASAPTYKLVGENTLTGNTWDCETGIATRAAADDLRNGWDRLESDYKISYRVELEG